MNCAGQEDRWLGRRLGTTAGLAAHRRSVVRMAEVADKAERRHPAGLVGDALGHHCSQ